MEIASIALPVTQDLGIVQITYNILYRKILLGQGNYYIKINKGEKITTIDKLKEMLETDSYNH